MLNEIRAKPSRWILLQGTGGGYAGDRRARARRPNSPLPLKPDHLGYVRGLRALIRHERMTSSTTTWRPTANRRLGGRREHLPVITSSTIRIRTADLMDAPAG